jgi:ribosome-binding protein aMBF1 (putative translation factor)
MNMDIEQKRAKLKSWLALKRMSRADLAREMGMSVTSINGWFSNVNIPDKKWELLKRLFEKEEKSSEQTSAAQQIKVVATIFSAEDAELIKAAADKLGISVEELVHKATMKAARQ